MIITCVDVYSKELADPKTAEKFIQKIIDQNNQVTAMVSCGKLKTAYLMAVKLNNRLMIERIRDEAKRIDDRNIFELCEKVLYLQAVNK